MSHAAAKHGDSDDLKESAVAAKDAVVDLAAEAGRYARHRAEGARDSAAAMLDDVKSRAGEYNNSVVGFIRKNPYQSLAIAAGIGLVAGFMLRRR